jgi:hypothetical protein
MEVDEGAGPSFVPANAALRRYHADGLRPVTGSPAVSS